MAAHNLLSWDEIVERGKQHNKTVICEVEKRGYVRRFSVICHICGSKLILRLDSLHQCLKCANNNRTFNNIDFIFKANIVHPKKYDYSLVEYVNSYTKIKIICKKCNSIFLQKPCGHLRGKGCLNCANNNKSYNNMDFIRKAEIKHPGKYDYSLVKYIGSKTKVKIICKKCNNIFEQIASTHLDGRGCTKCANDKQSSNNEDFISKANIVHPGKYDYSLVEYINAKTKVKIICKKCNLVFLQLPHSHLSGRGCRRCKIRIEPYNSEDFIFKANIVHPGKYDYSLVEYINAKTKVKIICKKCNSVFLQLPHSHLSGRGCPKCNESKGENRVAKYLSENNISFIPQKTFKTLRDINPLFPDFYLDDLILLIEYDGHGHYIPCFGSTPEEKQKNLEDTQRRDKVKNEWAKANNIPLLRIPYWDYDRIEELIEAFILQHTRKKETKQLVLEM